MTPTYKATLLHMSLQELVVEDLFDEFTHKIAFRTQEGLTILHGPNGVGKTTVLKVLDNLFNKKFTALRRMPLSGLQVSFSEGDRIQITKKHTGTDKPKSERTSLEFTGVITSRTGRTEVPEWLTSILSRVPVYFIEADRLSSVAMPRSRAHRVGRDSLQTATVLLYAEDLSEKIKKAKADYGDYSQTLDSTFPARLLQGVKPSTIPTDKGIRDRYNDQAARRTRYVKAGLLDSGDELKLPDRIFEDSELRVLDAYLTDVDNKLLQLDNIADKLELFLQIVNSKFRRKEILIDRQRGLKATTIPKGEALDLTSLSSGEQQELVLAYGLLFREDPGTLILLDEPELSLHVTWQTDLIPDLLRISELSQLEFLVATHSPQIINDRWDLTDELSDGA